MITSQEYSLKFSDSFEEYEGLSEAKDYANSTLTLADGRVFVLYFTTLHRLAQDAEYDLQTSGYHLEENLIIVRQVSRQSIETIVSDVVSSGSFDLLHAREP